MKVFNANCKYCGIVRIANILYRNAIELVPRFSLLKLIEIFSQHKYWIRQGTVYILDWISLICQKWFVPDSIAKHWSAETVDRGATRRRPVVHGSTSEARNNSRIHIGYLYQHKYDCNIINDNKKNKTGLATYEFKKQWLVSVLITLYFTECFGTNICR